MRATAPRYDASTLGLAYSQHPDGTTTQTMAALATRTHPPDSADIASDPDDVPERSKPFLIVGSSLAAIFVAGVMALVITMVIHIQPTVDQGSGELTVHPSAAAPPPIIQWQAPWVPPILLPPPYYAPRPQSPQWSPVGWVAVGPRWPSHGTTAVTSAAAVEPYARQRAAKPLNVQLLSRT